MVPEPTQAEWDVFVSFSSKDLEDARWLAGVLRRAGWKAFLSADDLDSEVGSEGWLKAIDEALDRSRALVLAVSPDALESNFVDHEWRSTHQDILRGRPGLLVPCCFRGPDPDDLERALRRYQAIDFREVDDRAAGANRLLDLIEHNLQKPLEEPKNKPLRRVLCLEGGGVRTFVSFRVLVALEERLCELTGSGDTRIADHFDLIAGSSTGGLLAASLLLEERFTAPQIFERCRRKMPAMLKRRSLVGRLMLRSKYTSRGIERALQDLFGERPLSALTKPCVIPVYDMSSGEPVLLTQHRSAAAELGLATAIRASMAAPTLFPSVVRTAADGKEQELVDGALFAFDPTGIAFDEARHHFAPRPLAGDIAMLTLANGRRSHEIEQPRERNVIEWVPTVIDIAMRASATLTHRQFRALYDSLGLSHQYLRVDGEWPAGREYRPDDNSRETLDELAATGDAFAATFRKRLDTFAQILLGRGT